MNPFCTNSDGFLSASYSDFVLRQVEPLKINEPVKVSVGFKTQADFRMNLQIAKKTLRYKVQSKIDKHGDLWLVRTE